MAELQQCHTCRWGWKITDEVDGLGEGVGECHRYAPRANPDANGKPALTVTMWPVVCSDDGCGDWTSRFTDT
jgi:hypothetical protein